MYTVQRSALVFHSAEKMSMLVNDVDRYQEFLPWCGGSRVITSSAVEMTAEITIAFSGIRRSFTTRNRLVGHEKTIVSLVEGPFRSLQGGWTYKALEDNASKISLDLEFDFANLVTEKIVGPAFKAIADSMVTSFCERADAR